jgi:hypothetical protein
MQETGPIPDPRVSPHTNERYVTSLRFGRQQLLVESTAQSDDQLLFVETSLSLASCHFGVQPVDQMQVAAIVCFIKIPKSRISGITDLREFHRRGPGFLNRCLLIPSAFIFESNVEGGMPSLAAAPDGPDAKTSVFTLTARVIAAPLRARSIRG